MREQSVLITGGLGGIGLATAARLHKAGHKIAIIDRRPRDHAAEYYVACADLTDKAEAERAFGLCLKHLGHIDAAINAAGLFGKMSSLEMLASEQVETITFGNIRMVLHAMQLEISSMRASGGGRIVNVASVAGSLGIVMKADYCAAKHATIGLSKVAALENIKHKIAVNTVSPGFIDTEMTTAALAENAALGAFIAKTPFKRTIDADAVAKLLAWLATEAPLEITGADYVIDGAYSAP